MPTHSEKHLFAYTPEQLFELVADVGAYPQFLPWCQGAKVLNQTPEEMEADLSIGFGFLTETFTSKVFLLFPTRIDVRYTKGPFRHLETQWRFHPNARGCLVEFWIDFEFKHPLFRHMMELVFEEAAKRMMTAFERRARELYTPIPPEVKTF